MKFPVITSLLDFKQAVAHKEEIKFNVQPNGSTVGCYMVSMSNTFDTPEAIECRGIVFGEQGVIGRPLHKFFNLGEKETTRIENIDWSQAVRVMDKRDGSMIHTVKLEHGYDVKSKKSYSSDVANAARKLIAENVNLYEFCHKVTLADCTAIFEYTAPTARIVLYYPEEKLTLLHIRNNLTGEYLPLTELNCWASKYNIPVVDEKPDLLARIQADPLSMMESTEQIEGWIIQFASGEMIKFKTKWYLERHRAMTFLRERDVARLVISEGIDDLKSLLVAEGASIEEIEGIETQVVSELNAIDVGIREAIAGLKLVSEEIDIKTAAIALQQAKNPYFGLIMATLRGKNPDIKEWFTRNMIDTYSLRQLNIMQTVGELE